MREFLGSNSDSIQGRFQTASDGGSSQNTVSTETISNQPPAAADCM